MVKHPIRRRDIIDDMKRRFEGILSDPFFREYERFLPSVLQEPYTDIVETENEVVFTAEIPGVKREDIDLNVTEDGIEVSVEAKEEEEKKGKDAYEYIGRYQGFRSSYSTPVPINPNAVKASYKNGVLEIRAPKLKATKGKKISVG